MPAASPPAMPGYNFPQPTHSGSLDLSAIKPVSSGSVSIQDALAKARGFAAQKGLAFDPRPGTDPWSGIGNPSQTYPMTAHQEDPRLGGRPYMHSRSRSRSPQRRDGAREGYNPYRDERRDERRGGGYGRERSRSPPRRETFSPTQQQYGGRSSPPNDNSEVILIDSSLVGLVIGRQGESLRRIEQESGTRIQFINGPEAGPQRQCRITGQPSARISAKRERSTASSKRMAATLLVRLAAVRDLVQSRSVNNNLLFAKVNNHPKSWCLIVLLASSLAAAARLSVICKNAVAAT
jgi:far upstream element-binding protein